jgi:hypothetical protein
MADSNIAAVLAAEKEDKRRKSQVCLCHKIKIFPGTYVFHFTI